MARRLLARATLVALVALVASSLTSCGSRATVVMQDGTTLGGELTGHDPATGAIQLTDAEQITEIPVAAVRDIDHPGNGLATTGSILVGLGTILIAAGAIAHFNDDDFAPAPLAIGSILFLTGAPLAVWGFIVWDRSRDHESAARGGPAGGGGATAGIGLTF